MEFTLTIEPEVVDTLGADKVNAFLQDAVARLNVKAAAQEALAYLPLFDELSNDPDWQMARQQAWDQEKHRYTAQVGQ